MLDLQKEILEEITEFLTPEEKIQQLSLANTESYKKFLPTIFIKLYKQHQEAYPDQPQDSDEERGVFLTDEEVLKQLAEQELFKKLVEIFLKIKDCDFPAIQDLKSQDLMKKIKAEIDAKENPYSFLYCRSLSASSLASQKSQEK